MHRERAIPHLVLEVLARNKRVEEVSPHGPLVRRNLSARTEQNPPHVSLPLRRVLNKNVPSYIRVSIECFPKIVQAFWARSCSDVLGEARVSLEWGGQWGTYDQDANVRC
jgi:hypothetical protein